VGLEELSLPEKRFKEYLNRNKMFYTRERSVILEAILGRKDHFSVDELMFEMQQHGQKVSRATLYRCLSQMVDAGVLNEADFGHGHLHYEVINTDDPHEHLICKNCGKITEVSNPDFTRAVEQLAQLEGFTMSHYKTQIFGSCSECNAL
jgi:Fur family transcriptional regulator, ferric uptake regulator